MVVAKLELQAKSMAQKIVREKVEEHKQKEVVKQRELVGLHNRAVLTLEDTKQEKHHLGEENESLYWRALTRHERLGALIDQLNSTNLHNTVPCP